MRTDNETDFKPENKRWIIEHTFAWFDNARYSTNQRTIY